jgi:hypothetical protein
MVKNDLHLTSAMFLAGLGIQMKAHGPERSQGMIDRGDDRTLRPQTFLLSFHEILAVWQRNGMGIPQGMTGEEGISVERLEIFSWNLIFQPTSLVQRYVTGSKGVVQTQGLTDLLGNIQVMTPHHPQIQLGQKVDIASSNQGKSAKNFNDGP